MTFPAELERLLKEATEGPWVVDPDDRPDMEWNNHITVDGKPWTICFMAHDPKDNSGQQAAAELIVLLRNHADAILGLVRAAELCAEVQDEPCRWDHNGYCQSHYLDHQLDGCRVGLLKEALAKLNGEGK